MRHHQVDEIPDVTERDALLIGSSILTALAIGFAAAWLMGPSLFGAWDAVVRRRIRGLLPQIESLHLDQGRVNLGLRLWCAAIVATMAVFGIWGKWLLAIPVFALIWVAPRVVVENLVKNRRTQLRDQMVGATVTLTNTTRAGLALAQGLETVAAETPEPLRAEFRQIVNEYQRGRPLPEALSDAKTRLGLEGFTLFASALLVCLERGGRVTDALVEISKSLQENQRLERKLEAETASGRMVVLILALFPFGFLALFSFINPEGTGLMFSTIIGQVVLVVVFLLVFLAAAIARKILSIDI